MATRSKKNISDVAESPRLDSFAVIGALLSCAPTIDELPGWSAQMRADALFLSEMLELVNQVGKFSRELEYDGKKANVLDGWEAPAPQQINAFEGQVSMAKTIPERMMRSIEASCNQGQRFESSEQALATFSPELTSRIKKAAGSFMALMPVKAREGIDQDIDSFVSRLAQFASKLHVLRDKVEPAGGNSLGVEWMMGMASPRFGEHIINDNEREKWNRLLLESARVIEEAKDASRVDFREVSICRVLTFAQKQAYGTYASYTPDPEAIRRTGRAALADGQIGCSQDGDASWSPQALDRLEADAEVNNAFAKLFDVSGGQGPAQPGLPTCDRNFLINLTGTIERSLRAAKIEAYHEKSIDPRLNARRESMCSKMRTHKGAEAFRAPLELGGYWLEKLRPMLLKFGAKKSLDAGIQEEDKDFVAIADLAAAARGRTPARALGRGSASPKMVRAFSAANANGLYAGEVELVELGTLTQHYSEHALKAFCSAAVCYAKIKTKGDLLEELATVAAMGFEDVDTDAKPSDYIPNTWAAAFQNEDGVLVHWKASVELLSDPMAQLVAAAATARLGEMPTSLAAVGEAKRILSENLGLGGAAWKAMASNPALRESFSKLLKTANPENHSSGKRSFARGSTAKRVLMAQERADVAAASLWSRLAKNSAKQTGLSHAKAAVNIAQAGALFNLDPEVQIFLMEWCLANGSATALLGGRIPLPSVVAYDSNQKPAHPDQLLALAADAKAWDTVIPLVVKSLAAKAKRLGCTGAAAVECSNALSDLRDVAYAMPVGFFSGLDTKAPLEHAKRMHDEWSRRQNQQRQMNASGGESSTWQPVFGGIQEKGMIVAQELSNGLELFNEGQRMSHCVASYSQKCLKGSSRIFAILKGGAKVCTLELSPVDSYGEVGAGYDFSMAESRKKVKGWKCVQNRGKHNASVKDSDILAFCEELAKSAQVQFELGTQKIIDESAQKKEEGKAKTGVSLKMKV